MCDTRVSPIFPRDIPPALAHVIISYARVIVRMPPERAEMAVRAMEAAVVEWRKPTQSKPLDTKGKML